MVQVERVLRFGTVDGDDDDVIVPLVVVNRHLRLSLSEQERAAVDHEGLAGEEPAGVAAEEQRDGSDVVPRGRLAAHRMVAQEVAVLGFLARRRLLPRFDAAPGAIALTTMPSRPHSRAAVRVSARIASFDALYAP